jgi:LmbE family N-acetylglucosaminyl deacetylase
MIALVTNASQPAARPAFEWPMGLKGKTILFAGAHPDDEWGLSPLLAEACLDGGAKCHFVVASDEHSYGCVMTIQLKDPLECSRRRREEMKRSAALFGGTAEFFGWEDYFYGFNQMGMAKTTADWATSVGGRDALVARWRKVLEDQKPSIVFTLDPRHGSTCHPGHRANAALVVEAVKSMPRGQQPELWFEQSDNIEQRSKAVEEINRQAGYVAWPDTASEVRWYDANRKLANGKLAYDYVQLVREAHATQYPVKSRDKDRPYAVPDLRFVPLAKYTGQPLVDYCTSLKIDLPTFDIPGNKERFGLK